MKYVLSQKELTQAIFSFLVHNTIIPNRAADLQINLRKNGDEVVAIVEVKQ
jgi:hypothetical protein